MGGQVRGDGEEVRHCPEGVGGFPTGDWKHLEINCRAEGWSLPREKDAVLEVWQHWDWINNCT